jgi:NADPH:quinone reductase-like Zn-dependent oxidoreductase
MRAWQLADDTGAGFLRLVSLPDPVPGPLEVVVQTRAVALNYRDLVVARGGYQGRVPVGAVPCSDAAGEVVAIGRDVSALRVGDRVTSVFAPDWVAAGPTRAALRTTLGAGHAAGVLAELVTLPASAVFPMASSLTFEEAATLPCAALTAWHALFEAGVCGAGQSVLTLGTGGVSVFAAQFACAAGASVVATSSDHQKLERLRALGVAHGINYRDVRALTARGEGVDLVVEVGGQGSLEQSMRAVRPGGTIALVGTLAGPAPVNLAPLFLRNIRLQGILVGSRDMFARMNVAIARWRIRPVIDRVFGFEAAPEAFAHLAGGTHLGKVVVRVGDPA